MHLYGTCPKFCQQLGEVSITGITSTERLHCDKTPNHISDGNHADGLTIIGACTDANPGFGAEEVLKSSRRHGVVSRHCQPPVFAVLTTSPVRGTITRDGRPTRRLIDGRRLFAGRRVLIDCAWIMHTPLFASTPAMRHTSYGDWRLKCRMTADISPALLLLRLHADQIGRF